MISIRSETSDDYDQIRKITVAAFAKSKFGHNGEADLIDCLRGECEHHLSLVACSGNEIVGHVLFTPVVIQSLQSVSHGMGLAPMCVELRHQGTGVGTSLLNYGLHLILRDGCPFIVVLGQPRYYPRFGFLPASRFRISHGFPGIPQDVFFILPNTGITLSEFADGKAYYHREFGLQHDTEHLKD